LYASRRVNRGRPRFHAPARQAAGAAETDPDRKSVLSA
jgi:hypothetical protein